MPIGTIANSKPTVTLTRFKTTGVQAQAADLTGEYLIAYLVETQKFDMVERDRLDKILEELKLASSDLMNEKNALKAGKLVSAYGIIVGSLIKLGNRITLSARLVSTQTGKVIRSSSKEMASLDELPLACKQLAYNLANVPMSDQQIHSGAYANLVGAVIAGDLNRVKELVKEGAPFQKSNETGVTPLMHAAYYGQTKIIDYLISKKASLESKDIYGQTALLHAAHRGKADTVKLLLSKGANVNARAENNFSQTALMYAAYFGYEDVVKILIQAQADLNLRNSNGSTALSYARSKGYQNLIRILENVGAEE